MCREKKRKKKRKRKNGKTSKYKRGKSKEKQENPENPKKNTGKKIIKKVKVEKRCFTFVSMEICTKISKIIENQIKICKMDNNQSLEFLGKINLLSYNLLLNIFENKLKCRAIGIKREKSKMRNKLDSLLLQIKKDYLKEINEYQLKLAVKITFRGNNNYFSIYFKFIFSIKLFCHYYN